jgi:hypothetical protein
LGRGRFSYGEGHASVKQAAIAASMIGDGLRDLTFWVSDGHHRSDSLHDIENLGAEIGGEFDLDALLGFKEIEPTSGYLLPGHFFEADRLGTELI